MNFQQLSEESKEIVKDMVRFCVNSGYRMGMDQGFKEFPEGESQGVKHDFRNELEIFCGIQEAPKEEIKGVHIETTHHANIAIRPSANTEKSDLDLDPEVQAALDPILDKLNASVNSGEKPKVCENSNFAFNFYTEVALEGTCLKSVTQAAQEIAEWAQAHPELEIFVRK